MAEERPRRTPRRGPQSTPPPPLTCRRGGARCLPWWRARWARRRSGSETPRTRSSRPGGGDWVVPRGVGQAFGEGPRRLDCGRAAELLAALCGREAAPPPPSPTFFSATADSAVRNCSKLMRRAPFGLTRAKMRSTSVVVRAPPSSEVSRAILMKALPSISRTSSRQPNEEKATNVLRRSSGGGEGWVMTLCSARPQAACRATTGAAAAAFGAGTACAPSACSPILKRRCWRALFMTSVPHHLANASRPSEPALPAPAARMWFSAQAAASRAVLPSSMPRSASTR